MSTEAQRSPLPDPDPLFTHQEAGRLVPRRAFDPAHAFFARHADELCVEQARWFPHHHQTTLRENPDNYGLYLRRPDAPVPFLWFGLGWGVDDGPDVLPSWGASFEVNLGWVSWFLRGDAGLHAACEEAERTSPRSLGLHLFEHHVELAEWRSFEWLLEQPDQREALRSFWASYLERLGAAGVPEAADGFTRLVNAAQTTGG